MLFPARAPKRPELEWEWNYPAVIHLLDRAMKHVSNGDCWPEDDDVSQAAFDELLAACQELGWDPVYNRFDLDPLEKERAA